MPHSVKCIGRVPRTMHNFLRGHIGDGGALKYGGDNLSLYQRDPLYDLEAQRVNIWPEAKNTLNKFLQQCYTLRPGQIIPHDGYTQAEVAEIGKQNLERMQKILGGFN